MNRDIQTPSQGINSVVTLLAAIFLAAGMCGILNSLNRETLVTNQAVIAAILGVGLLNAALLLWVGLWAKYAAQLLAGVLHAVNHIAQKMDEK